MSSGRSTLLVTTPSTFSYDVIFTMGADQILAKFKDFDSRLVFSAEGFCWPDESLAVMLLMSSIARVLILVPLPSQAKYPRVGLGKRFLCSGGG